MSKAFVSQPSTAAALTRASLLRSEAQKIRGRYANSTAVLLASGPSLSAEQIGATMLRWRHRQCVVFTVNRTWRRFPMADIHYSNDPDWFATELDDMRQECRGEFWCGHPEHTLPGVHVIPFDKKAKGLESAHPDAIAWAGNSGAACISLAAMAGCTRILLAGYDQQGDHWHEPHPEQVRKGFNFPMWAQHFACIGKDAESAGIEIVNCSHETSLTCFPRGDLAKELAKCCNY